MSISLSSIVNPNLGWNQSIQNVTSSRSASVTYTNSTGSPIFVWVSMGSLNNGDSIYLYISGSQVAPFAVSANASATSTVCGIVPNGASYYITLAGNASKNAWYELR